MPPQISVKADKGMFTFVMNIKIYMAMLILSIGLVSCGSDEPEAPKPNEPDVEWPTDEEDSAKYDIVGSWRAQYEWSLATETINLDINQDGTLSYISTSTNDQDPIVGNGDWEYQSSEHQWYLRTGYSMISGPYILVGNQLIKHTIFDSGSTRTVIYNRVSK